MADVPLAALAIQPPQVAAGGGGTSINPFQAGVDIMRMQQLGNENRQFQLKQYGYQGAAEIMAKHAGDEEGGLRELMASPYAPYAIDFVNTARSSMQALGAYHKSIAETGEVNLRAGDTAQHVLLRNMAPYYNAVLTGASDDELNARAKSALEMTQAVTAGMSPDQQRNALSGAQAAFDSINANLPSDPAQARRMRLDRMASLFGATYDKTAIDATLGETRLVDTPQGLYPTRISPVSGVTPLGPPLVKTIAPGYQEPGRIPEGIPAPGAEGAGGVVPGWGGYGYPLPPGAGIPGSGPNALGGVGQVLPPTPPVGQGAPAMQPIVTGQAPTAGQAPITGGPTGGPIGGPQVPIAGDGKPLYTPGIGTGVTPGVVGTGQKFVYSNPGDESADNEMLKVRNEAGLRAYDGAQNAQFQLTNMDRSLDAMAGTPLETGAYGEQRLRAARGWNTAFDILGATGLLDPKTVDGLKFKGSTIQEAESFLKSQTLAQFATVVNNFGAQREAAQTIQRALMAVPGMDNTYMGNKLVLEGLRAVASRVEDHWKYQDEWMKNNHGSLKGMEDAFNADHPARDYAQGVLDKFGLGPNGFTSGPAIDYAFSHGWIDKNQAIESRGNLPAVRPETVQSP